MKSIRKREKRERSGDTDTTDAAATATAIAIATTSTGNANKKNLTVAELAHTLQSDDSKDAIAIWKCLRQFSTIVKQERRIALQLRPPRDADDDDHADDDYVDEAPGDDDSNEEMELEYPLHSTNEDEVDKDNMEEGEGDLPSPPKRRRLLSHPKSSTSEAWKEDTQDYNVPFVGTSIATSHAEKYPVVKGTWPTGLLQAYLNKSPLAVEFLHPHGGDGGGGFLDHQKSRLYQRLERNHQQKLAQAIDIAYLEAINELVTAAIPIEKLQQQTQDAQKKETLSTQPPRFLNELIQKKLPRMVSLFLEETTSKKASSGSKGRSSSSSSNNSTKGPQSQPGSVKTRTLVPTILQVFISLSETCASVAAKVFRSVQQESSLLSSKKHHPIPNPWKFILQQQQQRKNMPLTAATNATTSIESEGEQGPMQVNDDAKHNKGTTSSTTTSSAGRDDAASRTGMQACLLAIQLATVWLQQFQSQQYLLSSIAASGTSNISPPGLLFCVLKDGIGKAVDIVAGGVKVDDARQQHHRPHCRRLCRILTRLLSALHNMLNLNQQQHTYGPQQLWRSLGDVLSSRECLSNLVRLATTLAPPLLSYEAVLQCQDMYENESTDEKGDDDDVSSLLVSESFQVGISARRFVFCLLADPNHSPLLAVLKHTKTKTGVSNGTIAEQQLVRAMLQLLASSPGVEIQRFLAHCVESTTPPLLLALPLMRLLPIPDCSATNCLPFCKTMRFLVRVLRSVGTCRTNNADFKQPVLWPTNLKKQHLTKALLSSNPLVVSAVLQFLQQVLINQTFSSLDTDDADDCSALVDSNLPDPSTVARIPSVWKGHSSINCSSIVAFTACSALPQLIHATRHLSTHSTSMEWVKLLIPNATAFAQSPLWLQRKLLTCLEQVFQYKDRDEPGATTRSSPRVLLEIALVSKCPKVYEAARRMALSLFPCPINTLSKGGDRSTSVEVDVEFEYSCWIDGIAKETLDEFCTLLNESSQEAMIRCRVIVAKAWKHLGLPGGARPKLNVSSLMVLALQRLLPSLPTTAAATTNLSPQLTLLTCQVAARCLVHHFDPLPLAALIAAYLSILPADSHSHHHHELTDYQRNLSKYATSLVHFDYRESQKRVRCLKSMVTLLFSSESLIAAVTSRPFKDILADDGSTSFLTGKEAAEFMEYTFRQMSHLILITDSRDGKKRALQLCRFLLPAILKVNPEGLWPVLKRMTQAVTDPASSAPSAVDLLVHSSGNILATQDIASWMKFAEVESSTSESLGAAALYLYIVGPLVPISIICLFATKVLEFSRDRKMYQDIGILYIRRVIETKSYQLVHAGDLALTAFSCWRSHVLVGTDTNLDFLLCLEQLLCSFLSPETPASVAVPLEVEIMEWRDLTVSRCLSTKQLFRKLDASKHKCLLATLIECDTVVFAPLVLQRLVSDDSDASSILACGQFDVAVRNALRFREGLISYPKASHIAAKYYLRTTLSFLARPSSCSVEIESLLLVLPELVELGTLMDCDLQELTSQIVQGVTKLLDASCDGDGLSAPIDDLASSVQEDVVTLAFILCQQQSSIRLRVLQRLASALIFRLLLRLPTVIRSHSFRTLVIERLCALLESSGAIIGDFDWEAALRPCLMYGLRMKSSRYDEEASLLKVASRLVAKVLSSDSNDFRVRLSCLAAHILKSITRHSKFHVIATLQEDDEAISVKLHMLELMVFCASAVKEALPFEEAVFDNLLHGFDAGTTACDTLIRKLLHLYSDQAPEDSDCVTLDRLYWRGVPKPNASRDWSWLPEALDVKRMNTTLSMFPIADPLAFEVNLSVPRELSTPSNHASSSRGTPTRVYSPGFLLPFVLSAMESASGMLGSSQSHSASNRSQGTTITVQSVQLAHRLCDKGCVALSMASLSSSCPLLRRVAVSILGKFTLIVVSTEARQYPAWKERPQIAMLLQSIQKALSIRMSEEGNSRELIPKLPGMTALFLARACVVLARPFDDMHTSINRYFLQSLTDHGAFQDLFRVPGFISMYHSSVDEPGLARTHRQWALKLVKDGFLDDDCFKPLVSCHAPELLLSSVENCRHRNQSSEGKKETCLLLNSLLRILETGGSKTHEALTVRFGLLHWLRSFLVGRSDLDVLPDAESRLLLLRIAYIAVDRGWKMLGRPEMREWCSSCAQPIVELALYSIKDAKTRGVEELVENLQWQLSSCTSDLLSRLGQYVQEKTDYNDIRLSVSVEGTAQSNGVDGNPGTSDPLDGDDSTSITHPDGVDLKSALELLLLANDKHRNALTLALCTLPWRPVTDDYKTAEVFCQHLLAAVDKTERCDFNVAMLKRIAYLASCHEFDRGDDILKGLLLSRRRFNRQTESKQIFLNCVSILSDMDGHGS